MTLAVLPRKIYEPGGCAYEFLGGKCRPLAPQVAQIERNERNEFLEVTWREVMERRRKHQREKLDHILWVHDEPDVCPCYVWTFFNPQDIPYYGWYCYVVSRHFDIAVNFREFRTELALSIMEAIPLGLLPIKENFYKWIEVFSKTHPRAKHKHDRRKSGSCVGWISHRRRFTLDRP